MRMALRNCLLSHSNFKLHIICCIKQIIRNTFACLNFESFFESIIGCVSENVSWINGILGKAKIKRISPTPTLLLFTIAIKSKQKDKIIKSFVRRSSFESICSKPFWNWNLAMELANRIGIDWNDDKSNRFDFWLTSFFGCRLVWIKREIPSHLILNALTLYNNK